MSMSRANRASVPTQPNRDGVLPRTAPPFLPAPDGGYALAHVVEWQRAPSGEVKITLAANDAHTHGQVARTKVLPPADALIFLAAIDALTGDHHVHNALTAERDAAQIRCAALEDALKALQTQIATSQMTCARLESECDTTARTGTAAHRRAAKLIRLLAEIGWKPTRITRALGGDPATEACIVDEALAAQSQH